MKKILVSTMLAIFFSVNFTNGQDRNARSTASYGQNPFTEKRVSNNVYILNTEPSQSIYVCARALAAFIESHSSERVTSVSQFHSEYYRCDVMMITTEPRN